MATLVDEAVHRHHVTTSSNAEEADVHRVWLSVSNLVGVQALRASSGLLLDWPNKGHLQAFSFDAELHISTE